jgi:two-component system sensor histidine kinase DesK
MFVDPYQRDAPWTEWVWTGLAFVFFFLLCATAAIYWSRKQILLRVCIAMTALAVAFTAYRPSGVAFFAYVAVFGPFAVGGNIGRSAAITIGAVALILAEWNLFWPPSSFPYVFALVSVVAGVSMTFVARQQRTLAQFHKATERERIARDLHDILGHTLSVITLKSELASRLLELDPQRAKSEIEDVERISRNALSEVRDAIAGYHTGGLAAEIERARTTLATAGIVVEHQCEEIRIPAAQDRVLALVLREAVTNVVRHAQAKRCRMALQMVDGICRLEISDDGRGGDLQEGMGMRGVRERVTAMGGKVSWHTGLGTALTITVPIAFANEAS